MKEKITPELQEREGFGQEIYVNSMELSGPKKLEEIMPWIKEGVILDLCAGAGPITDLLAGEFPESKVVAVDLSSDMVRRMKIRFEGRPNIEVLEGDVTTFSYENPFDTAIFISGLHEVFSFGGYNHKLVIGTLQNLYNNPKFGAGGRLIIRDGVQPEPETLYLKPLTQFACDRFEKFIEGFRAVRNVNFMIGEFQNDVFVQTGRRYFEPGDVGNSLIEISSQSASELLSKYHYAETNLKTELSEQFGIWTLREYRRILENIGFTVRHAETFLLPYLLENHYNKDWGIFKVKEGTLTPSEFPPSTMLLVAEKS